MLQLGLEADHVPQRAERIVLAQLHHGMGPLRLARIAQADRLHRSEAQRLRAARRHHFDRQAAFEIGRGLFPFLEIGLLAGEQRGDEGVILVGVHRTVDVVRAVALVVARLHPADVEIDGLAMHDGRDGVEEGERILARQRARCVGQRGEVSGPVAMMVERQSLGGSPAISSRAMAMLG